ncbi:hypothetical protein MKW98_021010 [Papaver atlanticum]|uniref:Uncharacterized protein n=1 Tax=Papaver atlanticum TaxID=357466 RepID=A0AAD4SL33_9MAGN|nr:hypothetical protein MKW98_021010 [Papaver atlanticum]
MDDQPPKNSYCLITIDDQPNALLRLVGVDGPKLKSLALFHEHPSISCCPTSGGYKVEPEALGQLLAKPQPPMDPSR